MIDKPILTNEDRSEMLKFYQTITVDGNGKAVKMKYDEHIVRHDTLRLLADTEHFLTVIDSQSRTIKTFEEVQQGWIDSHARNFKQIEEKKNEISTLITTIESQRTELDRFYKQFSKDGESVANLWEENERLRAETMPKDILIESQAWDLSLRDKAIAEQTEELEGVRHDLSQTEDQLAEAKALIESLQDQLKKTEDWETDAYAWRDFCDDRANNEDEFSEDNFTLMKQEFEELKENNRFVLQREQTDKKDLEQQVESQKEEIERMRYCLNSIANRQIGVFGEGFGYDFHYKNLRESAKKCLNSLLPTQEGEK